MKILYLAHRIPYPPNKGDKLRSFNEIKYLSISHEVHLACTADDPADLRYQGSLKKYCKRVRVVPLRVPKAKVRSLASLLCGGPLSVGYFYSNSLQVTVDRWLSAYRYDAVICFSSPMAEYLFRSPFLRHLFVVSKLTKKRSIPLTSDDATLTRSRHIACQAYSDEAKPFSILRRGMQSMFNWRETTRPLSVYDRDPQLIMDFCDLDSDKWAQYAQCTSFPLSLVYSIENRRLLKYEKSINQRFDHSVFVSQHEADLFFKLCPEARNVSVISNGVDYEYFSPDHATLACQGSSADLQRATGGSQPILLFTGAMDYHANIDGVTWFCDKIFPGIKSEFPESQFYIVGSNPTQKVRDLGNKSGVSVTGFVEDIRPYYMAAHVSVICLRLARGIQNKVLEAMAMGNAVVTTHKAVEGINAIPDEHVIVEDTPRGFSAAVCRLLKDRESRVQFGAKARSFVTANYDWTTNMKKLDTLLGTG